MLWVQQAELSDIQLDYIKKQYTHINEKNPDVPFQTYLELKGKIGIPYGDLQKVSKVLPTTYIEDRRIAPIFDTPKTSNMPLRDYQETAMQEILEYYAKGGTCFNLSGKCGCVDKDTEFLTLKGWKKISEYTKGDMVAQYTSTGGIEFVAPTQYIEDSVDKWIEIRRNGVIISKLSEEHRVVYRTSKGNIYEKLAGNLVKEQTNITYITNFYGNNLPGLAYTDNEIRLAVAISADANALAQSYKYRFNLKKPHKIRRLKWLLESLNIEYYYRERPDGFYVFEFTAKGITRGLVNLYGASTRQLAVISEEVLLWDGDRKSQFFTCNKDEADFVQYAFSSQGVNSNISICDRVGKPYTTNGKMYIRKSIEYTVVKSGYKSMALVFKSGKRTEGINDVCELINAKDGERKYCFTVPSGMFMARREGRIYVTGNSGKTYMLANLLAKLNTKVLIIANQRMLINQIATEITNVLGEAPNILSAKNTEIKDINVATSQFISQNAKVWYDIKEHIGLLVLDEAEALASNSVMRIFQRSPAKYRIFISATFTRSVDKRTGALTDFAGQTRILLENNVLIKPTIINVLCEEEFYPPMNKNMYTRAKIKFYNKPSINSKVLDVIKYSISKNRQVLVACDIIDKQIEIQDLCNNNGISARCLNGKTSESDRKTILEDYDSGKIKVILGLNVLNAGLSVPKISTIIRLSTSSSPEKLEQLIGRGQRDFLGKDGCYVIDFWFKGFKNKTRLQMYSLKERVEGWKVHTVQWQAFKDKYLK